MLVSVAIPTNNPSLARSPIGKAKSISSAVGLGSISLRRRKRNSDNNNSSENSELISGLSMKWADFGFTKKNEKKEPSSLGHKKKVKKRKKVKIQPSYG